jgi:hypothetical protein
VCSSDLCWNVQVGGVNLRLRKRRKAPTLLHSDPLVEIPQAINHRTVAGRETTSVLLLFAGFARMTLLSARRDIERNSGDVHGIPGNETQMRPFSDSAEPIDSTSSPKLARKHLK